MEKLINDSRNIIGNKTADEMLALTDNAAFFTAAVRYAILSDHEHSGLFSPDLSDTIQNSHLPSITEEFVGRKNELKECEKLLQKRPTLFINGVAGIGKSEFAKYYADKNRKKYTNIIYLYYAGDLKKSIAGMDYKAELFLIKNDYKNALKKRLKAVSVLEPYHTENADQRTANLLSNLYNNLSNTYLLMKKMKETAEMLHTALTIRQEYTHLGLAESHNMLQQLLNLTNMLILSKNPDMAKQVLSTYENLVLEHEGTQTLDNGVCQIMYGAIALSEGTAKEAELHLLSAENIISEVMGTDNDYAKTVYLYLNNLYSRWQKPEQALAYKNKYIECSK